MQPVKEEGFLVSEPFLPFTAFINNGVCARIHWHTYIELLYVINGSAEIIIDCETYCVQPGDFMIINSQESHASSFLEGVQSEILVIQFEPSVINQNLGSLYESKYIVPFLQRQVRYSKHIKLDENCELKQLLTGISDEFASKQPGYELSIKGDIYKVFAWLIRNNHIILAPDSGFKAADLQRLGSILEYIEKNYREQITIQDASKMQCMSYHHFCRFFKKATGKTFLEYLNFVRLCESEKQLITTSETISQIALNTGFPSISYFNRLFKKAKGMSPLSFRKQNSSKMSHN